MGGATGRRGRACATKDGLVLLVLFLIIDVMMTWIVLFLDLDFFVRMVLVSVCLVLEVFFVILVLLIGIILHVVSSVIHLPLVLAMVDVQVLVLNVNAWPVGLGPIAQFFAQLDIFVISMV